MKHPRGPTGRSRLAPLLTAAALAATITGCASIAEKVASHLAEKDVKALDQEFKVFHADLALFRKCLKERGGTCQGTDTTALPGTSRAVASQAVTPVATAPTETLADSVAKLPPGDPAKSALKVLGHPVVAQAAALHNHLRGHDTGEVQGVSVEKGQGADGVAESTVSMSMGVGHVQGFHKGLMSSLGSGGWESLHDHCKALLAAHGNAAGQQKLEADCRRVAFIRGYLKAYIRNGRFLTVDVDASGVIHEATKGASRITGDIYALLTGLQTDLKLDETSAQSASLQACAPADGGSVQSEDSKKNLAEVSGDAKKAAGEVDKLIDKLNDDLETRTGKDASDLFKDLSGLTKTLGSKSETLTQAIDKEADKEISELLTDFDRLLGKVCTELGKAVAEAKKEFAKLDTALRNKVFRASNVGFISRDLTFGAKLPALEFTINPTAKHLLTLTENEEFSKTGPGLTGTGESKVLTSKSDFGDLGVVTVNSSGVATGKSIGAEIVRVFMEAVFDAHEGLPALPKATGLTLGQYSLPSFSPSRAGSAVSPPDGTPSPPYNVTNSDLTRMTNINDQVGAATQSNLSRIIAGIGPFSLNNQPLEEVIVEVITTSVRKATAKATWCFYACNLGVDLKAIETDAKTAVDDKVKAVESKLESKLKAEEGKVEADVKAKADKVEDEAKAKWHEGAEHVKLRFKLTK